jgi:putative nucleotidyltransferase with HDIG domain
MADERRPGLQRWSLFAITLVAIAALLYSVYGERQRFSLQVGEPSPQTFVAPVDVQIIDQLATERRRQVARSQIRPVYTADANLQQLVLGSLTTAGLPADVLDYLVAEYQDPEGVTEEELPTVVTEAIALAPADREREVRLTLQRMLVSTSIPNDSLTQAARNAAAAAVSPVLETLSAGQTIVAAGERLAEDQLRALEAVGLYNPRSAAFTQTIWIVLGSLLLGAAFAFPVLWGHRRMASELTFKQVAFIAGLALVVLAVQRLGVLASPSFVFVFLVPIMVTVLVSEVAGLLTAVWVAAITALLIPSAPLFTFTAVTAGGVVAARAALSLRSRVALLLAGAAGGLVSAVTLAALALVGGGYTAWGAVGAGAFFVAGGILAGVVGLGLLPLAESVFEFLTDFRLLELSSPSSPLLQKLLVEAPGSYQHSLIISNLVEQAVKNIGGNALLARVGALYHDVGKLRRPHFFAENQFSGENPHDDISPHLSYLIVISHVRDGVELLREYGVPRQLEPFVTEHHGTTVLAYFYKRALEDSATLDELSFRYPGPRPRSKETAVLMLADAVESTSRTLSQPSQGSIRAMIDRLIEQRLQDDQLAESPLNFHDLEIIANTFERMLTAILHRRISYPSAEEIKGLKRGGDSRRNPPVPSG